MDITFISDTHGLHYRLNLSGGTVLVHSGDITEYGTDEEVIDFLDWFCWQPYLYKIFIGGNHDLYLEAMNKSDRRKLIPSNVIYLQKSGIEIEGLKFWGSPVTPRFLGMAFNVRAGEEIKRNWQMIPADTDILITHGPPHGILDNEMGDEELLSQIQEIKPRIHCFGHIHGTSGVQILNGTTFINSAMVNFPDPLKMEDYRIVGKPISYSL